MTIIYNFSDVFWNLQSDSVSKTDHEGVKPSQHQNREVYCSTKTPSFVTQIYNSGSVYIGQANHEASWNMNSRISFNIYDNTTLSMDHVNAPCIIEHTSSYTVAAATATSDRTCRHWDPAAKLPFGDVVLPPATAKW